MNLIFLGPPGAGKGTMAARLARTHNVPHISTGELFRAAIAQESALGKRVKSIIDSGALVPDEVTVEIVQDRFKSGDIRDGYILDGFPRTIFQADALASFSRVDAVVNFVISDSEVVRRLSGRRICTDCKTGFHIEFMPTKVDGVCDVCGGELIKRNDDSEDSIKTRLAVYQKQTQPLIEYYAEKELLIDVDASPPPEKVYTNLEAALASN